MSEELQREREKKLEIRETGMPKNGEAQYSERRLYVQLRVLRGGKHLASAVEAFRKSGLEGVIYADANNAGLLGLLVMSEKPDVFVHEVRDLFQKKPYQDFELDPEMTMFGRTYSSGREPNLEDWLLAKPRRSTLNAAWPWAIWYPLRRKPEFELLTPEDQGKLLYEHAIIGRKYAEAGLATDVRLACYGLDRRDNEFIIGLTGPELYPLSKIVQDMRRSQQTAKYIQSLGPFFVGKAVWQSPLN